MRAKVENGIIYSPYGDCPAAESRSAYAVLMERIETHGSKTAVIFQGDSLTYPELQERLRRCVVGFRSRGIGPGDKFYAHVGNDIDNFVALCSVPLAGATLLSSDILMRKDEILERMKQGEATHVLTDGCYADDFSLMAKHCNVKELFLVGEKKAGFTCVSDFYAAQGVAHRDVVGGPVGGGCSFIRWTTGTTGASKCLEIHETRFLQQIACRAAVEMITPDDVFLAAQNVSSFFAFSLWFLALYTGATIAISESCLSVPTVPSQAKNLKAVKMLSFPSALRRMLDAMKTSPDATSALRKCLRKLLVIGSSMSPALVEELTSTFQLEELRSCYGMSEAGGYLTAPPRGDVSGLDVGFPVPGARMKIIEPVSGNILGPMERGEVLFDTPYMTPDCVGNQAGTAAIIDEEGWLHTGDLGYYNNDGRLFLCGRRNVVLNSLTRNVYPAEIEQCLLGHPTVEQAAVLGVPSPDIGEAPAAIVVLTSGSFPNERLAQELKEFVAERLPAYKHLYGGVYFADQLPTNSMAKVRRSLLPELLKSLHRMDCAKYSIEEYEY